MSRISAELQYSAAQSEMFFESAARGRFRLFPKGRRLGATRGASSAFIEWMLEGKACLWGDTINGNIDRYVERYFEPTLRVNKVRYNWNQQKRVLKVGPGYTDFRSADRPENWEGFGYHVVFLNEAGIILDDRYLYENAVLPMLTDFPDSTLVAAGTPKLRQGKGRLFKELWDKAEAGEPGYYGKRFTTYDNPFLTRAQIDELAREIGEAERGQEIYGRFLEAEGTVIKREWLRRSQPPVAYPVVLGVDLAISTKEGADYTAIAALSRSPDGPIYVRDVVRFRAPFHGVMQRIIAEAERWHARLVMVEQAQYQAAVVQELLRTTSLPVQGYRPDKDKLTRAQPLIARYEQGLIYHVPGLTTFEDELLAFPIGEHDDQVDAVVIAFNGLGSASKPDYSQGGLHRRTEAA